MEKRNCQNCGREYAVVKDDALVAYNDRSPWLDCVCKRCTCYLRRYHKWTVTDQGVRICAACFLRRIPIGVLVAQANSRRKRELAHKKVHKGNESP